MVLESPRRALSNDINSVGEFVELKKLLSKTTIFGGGHFFLSHTVGTFETKSSSVEWLYLYKYLADTRVTV